MSYIDCIRRTHRELEDVSPTFCLAKWLMVTLHLEQGETHSCYHPWTHKIPLDELENNPSALHNTQYKKEQRKLMLHGKRPEECQYCWNVEDLGKGHISDRMIRSSETWARPEIESTAALPWDANVNPRYLEVSFNSTCNLKCSYCNPTVSSKWREEIRQYGGYPTSTQFNGYYSPEKTPSLDKSRNPYIQAFWKWWPDLYKDLRVFRITGGEPLLSRETFRILDWLLEHPNPEMELAINSNLSVSADLIDAMIDKTGQAIAQKKIRKLIIYGSVDTHSRQAEYIRTGLSYTYFMGNVWKILDRIPQARICFTVTFNSLSIPGFQGLLMDILEFRREFSQITNGERRVLFDTPYLRFPPHLCIQSLTKDFGERILDHKAFMERNAHVKLGFQELEAQKIQQLHDWMMLGMPDQKRNSARKDFYTYVTEHDKRRGTSFLDTFPEMRAFFDLCRDLHESSACA